MSIVSNASKAIATTRRQAAAQTEVSEFDGFWINAGVYTSEDEDAKFVRLPRGIAVSDLKARKVYETMDPDFAAQVELMNEMILAIQEACMTGNNGKPLAEGQSIPINLSAVLYRRQEEAEVVRDKTVASNIRAALFAQPKAQEPDVETDETEEEVAPVVKNRK
jgi:hypothetical protein